MRASKSVQDSAFDVWSKENESLADRYGHLAFKIIGITGIAASMTATFWGGFQFHTVYIIIFFLSLLFLIGAFYWEREETPNKVEVREVERYGEVKLYDSEYDVDELIENLEERRKQATTGEGVGSFQKKR
jgi:hypothetical protein